MANFLDGLPSYNESNFTKFHVDASSRSQTAKKPAVYICTKDHPSEQVITTEKTNILLRYLHQQWDKKSALSNKKRDSGLASLDGDTSPVAKLPRLDPSDDSGPHGRCLVDDSRPGE